MSRFHGRRNEDGDWEWEGATTSVLRVYTAPLLIGAILAIAMLAYVFMSHGWSFSPVAPNSCVATTEAHTETAATCTPVCPEGDSHVTTDDTCKPDCSDSSSVLTGDTTPTCAPTCPDNTSGDSSIQTDDECKPDCSDISASHTGDTTPTCAPTCPGDTSGDSSIQTDDECNPCPDISASHTGDTTPTCAPTCPDTSGDSHIATDDECCPESSGVSAQNDSVCPCEPEKKGDASIQTGTHPTCTPAPTPTPTTPPTPTPTTPPTNTPTTPPTDTPTTPPTDTPTAPPTETPTTPPTNTPTPTPTPTATPTTPPTNTPTTPPTNTPTTPPTNTPTPTPTKTPTPPPTDTPSPTPAPATQTPTPPPPPKTDISLVKTDDPDPVQRGGTLTYNITVSNVGSADAEHVVVTDTLPADVTLISATPTQGSCNLNVCLLGTIPAGQAAGIAIVVTVNADAKATFTNLACAATSTFDKHPENNCDDEDTHVPGAPTPTPLAATATPKAMPRTGGLPGDGGSNDRLLAGLGIGLLAAGAFTAAVAKRRVSRSTMEM